MSAMASQLTISGCCLQVRHRSNGSVLGGYAAEYKGHATEQLVQRTLHNDLNEIFKRRFDQQQYEMFDLRWVM